MLVSSEAVMNITLVLFAWCKSAKGPMLHTIRLCTWSPTAHNQTLHMISNCKMSNAAHSCYHSYLVLFYTQDFSVHVVLSQRVILCACKLISLLTESPGNQKLSGEEKYNQLLRGHSWFILSSSPWSRQ